MEIDDATGDQMDDATGDQTDDAVGDPAQEREERMLASIAHLRLKGGQTLDDGVGRSPRLSVRLSQDLHDRVGAAASQRGLSPSALAREALESWLARRIR